MKKSKSQVQRKKRAQSIAQKIETLTLCDYCTGSHEICDMVREGIPFIFRFQDLYDYTSFYGGTFQRSTIESLFNVGVNNYILFHFGFDDRNGSAFIFIEGIVDCGAASDVLSVPNYYIVNPSNLIRTNVCTQTCDNRFQQLNQYTFNNPVADPTIDITIGNTCLSSFKTNFAGENHCYAGVYDKDTIITKIFNDPKVLGLRYYLSLAEPTSVKYPDNHIRVIIVGVDKNGQNITPFYERSHPPTML